MPKRSPAIHILSRKPDLKIVLRAEKICLLSEPFLPYMMDCVQLYFVEFGSKDGW